VSRQNRGILAIQVGPFNKMNLIRPSRALISVSDKNQLVDFAQGLATAGLEIFSTGGTRRHLEKAGVPVVDISAYTGFPEMMDGRLKTLHPKIFGGLLARHDHDDDLQAIQEHGIKLFELVVVNLYPFAQTISQPDVTDAQAIEQIDIGGPSLIRAAAKNHAFTTVVTDPSQYGSVLREIQTGGGITLPTRRRFAREAFRHTAVYDRTITNYFCRDDSPDDFAASLMPSWKYQSCLRYGENPHQRAALYADPDPGAPNLVNGEQLHGKELSYNNLLDLDAALAIVRTLDEPACAVIKHNNPCGAAAADSLAIAVRNAMLGDPVSAFGSILAMNCRVDAAVAEYLAEPGLFVEAIVAPSFDRAAVEILTTRPKWKNNVRLMAVGSWDPPSPRRTLRPISGGVLVQDADNLPDPVEPWKVVTEKRPTDELMSEMRFAWDISRHVKSNAIVLAANRSICGVGAGQMSRVDAVDIAIKKAASRSAGSAMASDAFFPFPDSIHRAADAGVVAVIQPGGSRKDDDVIAACNERAIPMVLTGRRHFKH